MIVTQIDSTSGHYVGFVWLDGKRFSSSVYGRARLGTAPAVAYCQHRHREQDAAERCLRRLLRQRERESARQK